MLRNVGGVVFFVVGDSGMAHVMPADAPLTVEVVNEQLVIRIGITTLAWAADHQSEWNPYDEGRGDFFQAFRVVDVPSFARDVGAQLLTEQEDGRTPLGMLLDRMSMAVVEDGELSIEVCPAGTPSAYVRDHASTESSNTDS